MGGSRDPRSSPAPCASPRSTTSSTGTIASTYAPTTTSGPTSGEASWRVSDRDATFRELMDELDAARIQYQEHVRTATTELGTDAPELIRADRAGWRRAKARLDTADDALWRFLSEGGGGGGWGHREVHEEWRPDI